MLILATDTSGKHGSIALAQCTPADAFDVLEVVPLEGGTFSAQLVPQIAELLARHRFTRHEIGAFAVATGPGSFTGLRVGLAAIKALAEVLDKPIAAVSLLEAVAAASSVTGQILAVMDAGRGEAFAGRYEIQNSGSNPRLISEELFRVGELSSFGGGSHTVTPDPNLAEILRSVGLAAEVIERPRSDAISRLGWRKIEAGETVLPEQLEANYIRRSDAEIFSKP